jgi:hypothetical protein
MNAGLNLELKSERSQEKLSNEMLLILTSDPRSSAKIRG